jgi:aminoglycoside/choline kinase family phosphotransferase
MSELHLASLICDAHATFSRCELHVSTSPSDISVLRRAGDLRLQQLERWLQGIFGDERFTIAVASADASFRRYFRVTRGGETLIAMDAPPDKEDMEPYVRIAGMLVEVGVNAPRVLYQDFAQGFLLNTDLGSRTYLAELADPARRGRADALYGAAMHALVSIQSRGDKHARTLPAYDALVLRRELALFPEWFCARHLKLDLAPGETALLESTFDLLIETALSQPRVFVHRDYHSRNLMVGEGMVGDDTPGILDFQDALYGPIAYDLVSLLRDCYIEWPPQRVRAWVAAFREQAADAGLNVGASLDEFQRWFDFIGVQRHLKVLGIFARLFHRDGKPGYLKDLPLTLAYVRAVTALHAELKPLERFIEERIQPAFERTLVATAGVIS